ncbi:MAG TPA: trypsin-like peptidase domain-containing protein [Methylomirabilota bacterium]|nr:trypsin-like peptidase domain-containing protein [Methylomirabilota bacterium]
MSVLHALEAPPDHLARVGERLREVTVEVGTGDGSGAGILWAPELIVTNAHVARAASLRVRLADDRQLPATRVAADRRADLALLRVPRTRVVLASLADSDSVRVGSLVVALGHPLGLRSLLTAGVVHALGPLGPGGRRWIQADLRLAPGNSGGPLADTGGHVVGLNTMIAGGLALAIPINDVRAFVSGALARSP